MQNDNFYKNKITVVNGIMCVLIVLLHCQNIYKYSDTVREIVLLESFISVSLGDLAVPTFFFMSSLLFFQNYDLNKIWIKYKSRIFSLLVPYLLWNLLYFVFFFLLINNPLSNTFMDTKEITVNAEVLINSIFFHQYNGAYWFMYQLILFVLISPVVYVIIKNPYGILAVPVLIVLRYWTSRIPGIPNGIEIQSLIYWLLGAYFVIHKRDQIYHRSSKRRIYLALSLSTVFLLVRFYLEFVNQQTETGRYIMELLLLPNVITLWFALDIIKFNKVYDWMKMSFFIYSIHPLILDTIKKAIYTLLPVNNIMALGNYLICGIGSILISVEIAKTMIRFTPKLYNVLCGGRTTA